jgi:hypothetical protein
MSVVLCPNCGESPLVSVETGRVCKAALETGAEGGCEELVSDELYRELREDQENAKEEAVSDEERPEASHAFAPCITCAPRSPLILVFCSGGRVSIAVLAIPFEREGLLQRDTLF